MIKLSVTALMLSCFIVPTVFSASHHEKKASSLSKRHTPSAKAKDSKAKDWLADLRGLPSREELEVLSKHVDEVMKNEKDKKCTAINPRLRKMIFLHFVTYQHIVNQRSVYLDEEKAAHWAHVFAMLLKESSGDTTNVTSMTGRSYTTYQAKSDLDRWRKIANLSKNGKIPLNYQTNFGLTQLSVDRLFVALQLARDPAYLEGKKKEKLNTALAVRRLIWFYQDFAQGRLTQEHDRIHHHERGNPEYSSRFAFGLSMALSLCGTNYMFYEGYHGKANEVADLTDAMASIAYCKIGNPKAGYGATEESEKCFAAWVTLCPTLNFDIAMLTPLKYFATRNAAPVCEGTFKALLKKKPVAHKQPSSKVISHESKQVAHQEIRFGQRAKKFLESASSLLKNFFTRPAIKSDN